MWAHLGIERSYLVGFSMGGYLAQAVTICHPDKVDRLILLSTSPGDHHVNHEVDSWITDAGTDLEMKVRNFFSPGFQSANPDYMNRMIELTRKAVDDGRFLARSAAQRDALFEFNVGERLHEITCPVLLVHGRSDRSVLPAAADELHARLKNSQLVWLDDTAHFCIIERPDEVLAAILEFLI
jgi:pimeloyl-ACP methyl ester carboxylesterase